MLIAVKYTILLYVIIFCRGSLVGIKENPNFQVPAVTERILSIGSNASFVVGKIKNSENLRPPLSLNY